MDGLYVRRRKPSVMQRRCDKNACGAGGLGRSEIAGAADAAGRVDLARARYRYDPRDPREVRTSRASDPVERHDDDSPRPILWVAQDDLGPLKRLAAKVEGDYNARRVSVRRDERAVAL